MKGQRGRSVFRLCNKAVSPGNLVKPVKICKLSAGCIARMPAEVEPHNFVYKRVDKKDLPHAV